MPWSDEEAVAKLAERLREMLEEDYGRNPEIEVNAALCYLRDDSLAEYGAFSDFIICARRRDWNQAKLDGETMKQLGIGEWQTYHSFTEEAPHEGWMTRSAEGWKMTDESHRIVLPRYGWVSNDPNNTRSKWEIKGNLW